MTRVMRLSGHEERTSSREGQGEDVYDEKSEIGIVVEVEHETEIVESPNSNTSPMLLGHKRSTGASFHSVERYGQRTNRKMGSTEGVNRPSSTRSDRDWTE